MSNQPTMEILREVWLNDVSGDRYEIGPDRDGLDMVEIRLRTANGELHGMRMAFSVEAAKLVARAMLSCANEVQASQNS